MVRRTCCPPSYPYGLICSKPACSTPRPSGDFRSSHCLWLAFYPFFIFIPIIVPRRDIQARSYGADVRVAPHTAAGPGLRSASTGVPASFTIRLAGADGSGTRQGQQENPDWEYNVDKKRFIYVWVASEDNVFVAGVRNNGNGTLTATYESSFPGDYLIHVEDVNLRVQDHFGRGRPIVGSPFSLTVSGDPAVDVDALPVCGGQEEEEEDLASSYWRTGSWVSSNIAARNHGVLRDGWVFQPKTCVYEAFSYDDLMLLAGLDEPTWLLALGNSILRGVFLTILDMALAQGQKDEFSTSVVKKCWGFIDVRIGNLRISYQVTLFARRFFLAFLWVIFHQNPLSWLSCCVFTRNAIGE